MEIDITDFVRHEDAPEFSASQMELGVDAAKITWGNAVSAASNYQWITDENRHEFERWIEGFGAWDLDTIKGWSIDECNALLIQFVSGDLRELESLCFSASDVFGINWDEAEKLSNAGTIGGRIYKGSDERVYIYVGD